MGLLLSVNRDRNDGFIIRAFPEPVEGRFLHKINTSQEWRTYLQLHLQELYSVCKRWDHKWQIL